MAAPGGLVVDLARLDEVVHDLGVGERELETLTADLEATMRRLHGAWDGRAELAQAAAHREWERGLATMREALADLRRAARAAHDNYDAATRTNLALWERLR
jgi:WXG100 family type VII secretion target